MKVFKILFVLICLLAYAWVFSLPAHAQAFQPQYARHQASGDALNAYPFNVVVERISPLFADRQMTLKIADVPAGQQVTVLEKYTTSRSDQVFILLVEYTDKSGKELMGWFYGTLRISYPH